MKKLNIKLKTDHIEKMIGNELMSKGYEYKCLAKDGYWCFKKYEEEVIKKIDIIDDKQYLTIKLGTNLKFFGTTINRIIPNAHFEDEGLPYDDLNSFVNTLKILKNLLEEYGFAALDRMGIIPEGPRVSAKSSIYIRDHHEEIVEKRKQEWRLEGKSEEEQLKILSKLIEDEKKKSFEDAESLLADIAAVYGDLVVNHYSGTWSWVRYAYNFVVEIDEGKYSAVDVPLRDVVDQWKGKRSILESYGSIRENLDSQKKQHDNEFGFGAILKIMK